MSHRRIKKIKIKHTKNNSKMGSPINKQYHGHLNYGKESNTVDKKSSTASKITSVQKSDVKGKMIITPDFLNRVRFICSKIFEVEWSGILFYESEGEITDPENFVITPIDILLMDKGTQASTSFEITPEVLDIFDVKPELETAKMGLIHSHNIMGVFFSGTDMDELKDNVNNHKFYVSLVVNNKMEMVAKAVTSVTIKTKIARTISLKNLLGIQPRLFEEDKETEAMLDVDLEIFKESENFDEFFTQRVLKIAKTNTFKTPGYDYTSRNFSNNIPPRITSTLNRTTKGPNMFPESLINKFLVKLLNLNKDMEVFPAHNFKAQLSSITKTLVKNSVEKNTPMTKVYEIYRINLTKCMDEILESILTTAPAYIDVYKNNSPSVSSIFIEEAMGVVDYYVGFDGFEQNVKETLKKALQTQLDFYDSFSDADATVDPYTESVIVD